MITFVLIKCVQNINSALIHTNIWMSYFVSSVHTLCPVHSLHSQLSSLHTSHVSGTDGEVPQVPCQRTLRICKHSLMKAMEEGDWVAGPQHLRKHAEEYRELPRPRPDSTLTWRFRAGLGGSEEVWELWLRVDSHSWPVCQIWQGCSALSGWLERMPCAGGKTQNKLSFGKNTEQAFKPRVCGVSYSKVEWKSLDSGSGW